MNDKFAKTKELLEKRWLIPIGREEHIKIEIAGDELYFKARILSAAEISEIRRAGIKPDGTIDPVIVEQANNEFIRKSIIEPEVDPETLHPLLKELLLAELLRIHGYDEKILAEIEKKLQRTGSGTI